MLDYTHDSKPFDETHDNKDELVYEILHFNARFRFDFTRDFLYSLSIERLKHILNAAMIVKA